MSAAGAVSAVSSVVIVGSGLAGYTVARELRKHDRECHITVVTADGGEFYSKPTLSNAFALKKDPHSLALFTASHLAGQHDLRILTMSRVMWIDRGSRVIGLDDDRLGRLPYDRLVLAVGGEPIRLKLGGSAADRVHSVNGLADYRRFRSHLEPNARVAILGAGLVGCEFANDLAAAGHPVQVIDIASKPLPRFWPAPMAEDFCERLGKVGIIWHFGHGVERIELAKDAINDAVGAPASRSLSITLDNGTVLQADTVLSAVGLSPNTALAKTAGLAVNRGIAVDRYLQTSDKHVYALGDCAEVEGLLLPYIMPIMHAGRALASTLSGVRSAVAYSAMPVVLKTPAHPAVFFPPAVASGGMWHVEGEEAGMRAFFRAADGTLLGAALSGVCVREKDLVAKQLPALLTPVPLESSGARSGGNLLSAADGPAL